MTSACRIAISALLLAGGAGCTAGAIDVATIAPDSLAAGLVAHWTFDDAAGASARDSSGNGRDGTILGAGDWSWTDGRFTGALQLTGTDQVSVGGFPQPTASYSVSAWLNVAVTDIEPPIAAVLSTEIPWGVGPPGGWSLTVDPPAPGPGVAGNYQFTYWFGQMPTDSVTAECVCFAFDKWTHLAAVIDATTDTLTFYVDGRTRQEVPVPRGIWPAAPGPLFMARYPLLGTGPGPVRLLAGAIDDVAIYSRALVPEEVAQLSRAPAPDPI